MNKTEQDLLVELLELKKEAARIKARTDRMINILGNDVEKQSQKAFGNYLSKVKELVEAGIINGNHFHWSENGTLKIWAKAVWDKYEASVKPAYKLENRELLQNIFYELSDLSKTGYLLVVYIPNENKENTRQRGYYIKNAQQYKLLADAFNCPHAIKRTN